MTGKKHEQESSTPSEKKHKRRGHGEGSIYLRKDGRWGADITLENGNRKTFYGKTRKEVADKLITALQEQKQGTLITAPQQTVASFLLSWLELKKREVKEGTYCYYKYNIECHIIPHIGGFKLQKVTSAHIQQMYTEWLKELKPNTVHLIHGMLRAALDQAVKLKKISSNPCRDVTPPRVEKREIPFLDEEQAQALLAALRKSWMIAGLIPLAIATGMRRGEMLALNWSDIDFEKKTVTVSKSLAYHDVDGTGKKYKIETPKTASGRRVIPLPDFALDALKAHRAEQLQHRVAAQKWEYPHLVFTNSTGGYYWFKILAEQFRAILQDAGLPPMPFHGLRHSAATILLAMGVDPNTVKQRLGHADIRTTLGTYGHVTQSMQDSATGKLDREFRHSETF